MPLLRLPAAFDHPDCLFELEHDGFRGLAIVDKHHCQLVSRRRSTSSSRSSRLRVRE
jgi:hypothetical protein